MAVKLGKGYAIKGDKITSNKHRIGDASAQIRRRKAANKPRPVSRAKALSARSQRP
jgi:hypothetical protein